MAKNRKRQTRKRQEDKQYLQQRQEGFERPARSVFIQPKNYKQDEMLKAIDFNVLTVVIGPAGTGKTFCTGMKVAQLFSTGKYARIVLTRANVPTGKSLGFFPGTVAEKMEPWLAPITNVLKDGLGKGQYEYLERKGKIIVQPIETIRGNSYEDALVIVDEAQNLSMEEIKAITTRIGENSKMILTGDPAQSDVKNGTDLKRFCDLCNSSRIDVGYIEFGIDDIVRSDIVGQLVKMFYNKGI
jgi:phosphate starvation-inducible PhoH-like protein